MTAIVVEAVAPQTAPATRAFSAFEWMVAFRYLRARNAQRSISVIAGFSFLGIVLGVAALIVVMSVMNGFQVEMLRQMSSISGQFGVQGGREGLDVTGDLVARLKAGGFRLLDTQFVTDHLKSFGAVELPRRQYHKLLEAALVGDSDFLALGKGALSGAQVLRQLERS